MCIYYMCIICQVIGPADGAMNPTEKLLLYGTLHSARDRGRSETKKLTNACQMIFLEMTYEESETGSSGEHLGMWRKGGWL